MPGALEFDQFQSEYRIGPQDVLELSIAGDDDLSRTYKVSAKGTITLPYLGEVPVEGLTKSELEKHLAGLLEENDILENPQVIVIILEYVSKMVSVLGAVRSPGRFELAGRLTLRQIIALAGGETIEAGDSIEIIRYNQEGTNDILAVSRKELYMNIDFDIPLMPNDIIRVLAEEMVWIYIGGQVNSPGRYEVRKSEIPTLLQAIILAGDFADRASEGNVILRHKNENGDWRVSRHDVNDIIKGKNGDIQLFPNDIIVVPKSTF
jgi:polysaccharide export outer membrane protein